MSVRAGQRVLITGGLGFIGSNLAHYYVGQGAQVTVYDCLDPKSGGNMHNLAGIEGAVSVVINDVRNFEALASAVRGEGVVFHCAAYTSHPNSMKEPLIDIDVNCKGTINLLEAARRFNPEVKIVHVGTSTQIGRMVVSPIDELHPEFPLDIYSANKSAAEKYVLIYAQAYGLRACVVRLCNVYGPRSNIVNPDFGFVNYFIGQALQGKELLVFGDGGQRRSIAYVDDAVQLLRLAAEREESTGEVYNAGSLRPYSVAEVAETISRVIGGTVRSVAWPHERAAIDIGDAVITSEKARSQLGWQEQFELASGMTATRDYFAPRLREYLGAQAIGVRT